MRAILGSVSDEAVHASPVPVLVIPRLVLSAEREAVATGPILVGDDGSPGASRALAAVRSLLPDRAIARTRVAFERDEDVATDVVTVPPFGMATTGRAVGDALVRHGQAVGAAAIVVGSRGRSASREIMLGSTAMATLHHTDRPVIVVPDR